MSYRYLYIMPGVNRSFRAAVSWSYIQGSLSYKFHWSASINNLLIHIQLRAALNQTLPCIYTADQWTMTFCMNLQSCQVSIYQNGNKWYIVRSNYIHGCKYIKLIFWRAKCRLVISYCCQCINSENTMLVNHRSNDLRNGPVALFDKPDVSV